MKYWILLDACTNPAVLQIFSFVYELIKVVFTVVPTILIAMMSFDFFKNVVVGDEAKQKKNLTLAMKRALFGIGLFLVPYIGLMIMNLVSTSKMNVTENYNSCLKNMENIDYYESLAKVKREKFEQEYRAKHANASFSIVVSKTKSLTSGGSSGQTNGGSSGQNVLGNKYADLTDEQINKLTQVCIREQGTGEAGIKGEASLMANLFEKNGGSKYGTGGSGLYNYVLTSGWFANQSMKATSYTEEQKSWVIDVLRNGNRTLPLYIVEHDYIGDLLKVTNNGVAITDMHDHSQYIKDVSKCVQNPARIRGGTTWTFYTFLNDSYWADPFGYFEDYKKKLEGSS